MNNRKANVIIFIIAIILSIVAIYFIMNHINGIREAYTNVPMKSVVVAAQNIPENVNITGEMLKIVTIPTDMVLPQAYDTAQNVVGSITKTDIVKDEHILSHHIYRGEEGKDKFSYSIPENMRAVSITINDVTGVSGLIKPNDHVDILVTYTFVEVGENEQDQDQDQEAGIYESDNERLKKEYLNRISEEILKSRRMVSIDAKEVTFTMLQNIEVLAIYGSARKDSDDKEGNKNSGTITFALMPEDVELLTNAEAIGNLKLSLRSPIDEKIIELEPITATR